MRLNFSTSIFQKFITDPSLQKNPEFLWRFGEACMMWANKYKKRNPKRRELIFEGREYAIKAYELNENSFDALRWTAILCGAATEYLGVKDRILQGKKFKSYLDKAIGIRSTEYTLLHLRGRFCYEVSNLSWLERKVCSTLRFELPSCTIDEALADFLAAEKFKETPWPENLLYIARCYAVKKQKKLAQDFLERAEAVDEPDECVNESIAEVRTMISNLL
ncbi:unnamed protein product [Enterobius vermicularis]|uniref:Regulator of microtubule dynamics protein 1 n=1 Tax=Enterobius vermicularis TaxID=51028 RepID=A0A0N4VJA4_ENTVE|nr:unnamed protein product [Enterobius vermicularis]